MNHATSAARLTGRQPHDFLQERDAAADRPFLALACILATASLGVAAWRGEWSPALLAALPAAAVTVVLGRLARGTRTSRAVVALALMVLVATLAHQAGDAADLRIGAIVLVAALLYYRDWLPLAVAAAAIAGYALVGPGLQGMAGGTVMLQLACMAIAAALLAAMAAQLRRELLELGGEPPRLAQLARGLAAGQPLPADAAAMAVTPGSLAGALLALDARLARHLEHGREADREALRIRAALDCVTTNVMIADADRTIVYANPSLLETLGRAEADIRRELPHFEVANLIGGSIDSFHRNPAHQSRILSALEGTHRTQIQVGGHVMRLTVNPVKDAAGQVIGYVVEWLDRTEEVRTEEELSRVVEDAVAGNLSGRLRLDDKHGFTLSLSRSLNGLLDNFAHTASRLSAVLTALAQGDLTARMEGEFHGVFARMRDDANATVDQLTAIVHRIQEASGAISIASTEIAAGNSDLSRRTEQQAANLEETAASMEELTSTVKQNADHARQANQLAIGAHDVATRGGEVVG
ncbi:methyl-accepting chemotaxis protein, partial [Pseudoxanthomonas sp. SGT-18]|uniref:methyl-accepting chemotaxis protein n=1 Tax=Pseudoxanthomonas sp. SGT-18 TaxID=2493087 RepID=UPI0013DDDB36